MKAGSVKAAAVETRKAAIRADRAAPHPEAATAAGADEVAVLLDAVIHDLRTPLSAMSGWLEVLETHFGEADGIIGRALLGLRRGVDSQTRGLNDLSDVVMKQRGGAPDSAKIPFLDCLQQALQRLDDRAGSPLGAAESARLEAIRALDGTGTLACANGCPSLVDACGTLLQAIAAAQADPDPPVAVTAGTDRVLITIPGASGDRSALTGLCMGLQGYTSRRPDIRVQALWLARAALQRGGLALRMAPAAGGGLELLLQPADL